MSKFNEKQEKAIKSKETEIVILAPAGSGKALKNGTGILTPSGYIAIEKLKIGDIIYDGDGKKTKVTGVYPQGKKEIFKITFSDGNIIKCSEDHIWTYQTTDMRTGHSKNWKTKSLREIINTEPIKKRSGSYQRANIFIPIPDYIDFNEQKLTIPPYLLGALIGDGYFAPTGNQISFSNEDEDVLERVNSELKLIGNTLKHNQKYDYKITSNTDGAYSNFREEIRKLKLEGTHSDTKFIPDIYKYNSLENRLELLKGLIDTDGYCGGSFYEYVTVSKQLADDIEFIIESLGMTVTRSIKKTNYSYDGEYKEGKDAHRLYIKTNLLNPKIHFSKKREKQWKKGQSYARRNFEKIEETNEYAEMTCISVDSPIKLFVTEHCIVTHNTTTLVGAIVEYKNDNPFSKIVAITFTRKAADDLISKLADYSGIRTSTIHSWAYTELERLSTRVSKEFPNNTFKVKLLEEDKIKEILNSIIRKRGYKYLNMYQLYSYVMGNYNIEVNDRLKRVFQVVKDEYILYKMDNGLYDFTDLPQYLLDKLNDYELNIESIDALFVDEFQDVDDVQLELFNRVPAVKKFYIGDPQQSIYIFRGATPDILERIEDFAQHELNINYRSYQEIIDFASTVRNTAIFEGINFTVEKESIRSEIECIKGYGGEAYTMNASGDAYKINEYVRYKGIDIIRDFIMRNSMILCRKNKEVREIKAMGYQNVSTIHQAKGLEYNSVIITSFELGPGEMEEINIAYVGMTRAEDYLLAADYKAFIYLLEKVMPQYNKENSLF